MSVLTLSGWGQPHDALSHVVPGAEHLDYSAFSRLELLHRHIHDTRQGYEAIIGWSLGGQLAVQALSHGILRAKTLVLISAPFRFVRQPGTPHGMPRAVYNMFCANFRRDPKRTLRKAWDLVTHNDRHADRVKSCMPASRQEPMLTRHWDYWLEHLGAFDCGSLELAHLPPTLIIHGESDAVVDVAQVNLFADRLPDARVVTWPGCGHAPHWHHPEALRRLIEGYV